MQTAMTSKTTMKEPKATNQGVEPTTFDLVKSHNIQPPRLAVKPCVIATCEYRTNAQYKKN